MRREEAAGQLGSTARESFDCELRLRVSRFESRPRQRFVQETARGRRRHWRGSHWAPLGTAAGAARTPGPRGREGGAGTGGELGGGWYPGSARRGWRERAVSRPLSAVVGVVSRAGGGARRHRVFALRRAAARLHGRGGGAPPRAAGVAVRSRAPSRVRAPPRRAAR